MSFDHKAFMRAKFEPRTKEVPVPELRPFTGGDTDPVWTVRGLTGEEIYRVKSAATTEASVLAVLEGLSGAVGKQNVEAIRNLCGLGSKAPEEHVKRLEMLVVASVDPKIDKPTAVKIAAVYPTVFSTLTDAILNLTGLGQDPGKSHGSGETPASVTP